MHDVNHYIFYYSLKYQIIKRQLLGEVVKNGKYFNHKLPRCFKYLFFCIVGRLYMFSNTDFSYSRIETGIKIIFWDNSEW